MKKSILKVLAVAIMLFLMVGLRTEQANAESTVSVNGNTLTISGTGSVTMEDLENVDSSAITKVVIKKDITQIWEYAFENWESLEEVELPHGLTHIYDGAFWGCSNLEKINIPDTLTYIGDFAFSGCYSMTSYIQIPSGVQRICFQAFGSTGITGISIPSSVTIIEECAFAECDNLKEVIISEGVKKIEANVFSGCNELDTINFPNSLTYIGNNAFELCVKLQSVELPDNLEYLGSGAFYQCGNLKDVKITGKITEIKDRLFYECYGLNNVEILCDIESIGEWAFGWCGSLKEIELPDTVTSIGEYAFAYSEDLSQVNMPESIISIDDFAFFDTDVKKVLFTAGLTSIGENVWTYLEEIEVDPNNQYFSSVGGVLYNKEKTILLLCPLGVEGVVVVPEGVVAIKDYAFYECEYVTEIKLPNSVRDMGDYTFARCELLEKINIPNGVTSIGEYTFELCCGLTSIDIPESVTEIGNYAFSDSGLEDIGLSNKLETIGEYAFCGCAGSETVYIPNSVKSVGEMAFACWNWLEVVYVPNSVTNIGEFAFGYDDYLTIVCEKDSKAEEFAIENDIIYFTPALKSTLSSKNVTNNSLTLVWTKNASADGYIIEQYSNGAWSRVKLIGDNSTLSYTVEGLNPTTTYKYRVYAYKVGYSIWLYGNYSSELSVKTSVDVPAAVTGFTYGERTASTIALKWTKNTSADGYVIELYKNNKWTVFKTIENNSTINYNVTGLNASTSYQFRIRAYKNNGDSKVYSSYATKTAKTLPSTIKGFTFSGRTASTVTLKWTKNTSADGYVIQQYKSGKWTTIKTITSKSTVKYKVTGLKPSKTYKFRIRAYKKDGSSTKIYSASYTEKSVKTLPSAVKGFTYKARTAKTITLKWYKNTSADGYVIQQYKGGKWVTIKTITNKSTVTYKVSGLKKNTSYKFRIKAYKKDGNKKLYSVSYTSKSVKTTA